MPQHQCKSSILAYQSSRRVQETKAPTGNATTAAPRNSSDPTTFRKLSLKASPVPGLPVHQAFIHTATLSGVTGS